MKKFSEIEYVRPDMVAEQERSKGVYEGTQRANHMKSCADFLWKRKA